MWRRSKGKNSRVVCEKKSRKLAHQRAHATNLRSDTAKRRHTGQAMEIVPPAGRRFWGEDDVKAVHVNPLVSPATQQRERRNPRRTHEVWEVKIPTPDHQQPDSGGGSSELRKLAFTVVEGGLCGCRSLLCSSCAAAVVDVVTVLAYFVTAAVTRGL